MLLARKYLLLLIWFWYCPSRTMGFWVLPVGAAASSSSSVGMMISNIMKELGGGGDNKENSNKNQIISLPRGVKEAVRKCRESTQEALKNRCSRMDIEFPVGTKFGVEKGTTTRKRKSGEKQEKNAPTQSDLQRSDRELARLFVDMFQPVGGNNIAVAFTDVTQADAAKKQWKNDPTAICRILSMDRRKSSAMSSNKKKKKVKAKGFAAKLAAEIDDNDDTSSTDGQPAGPFQLPENTEVTLFVAPGPKELVIIEKICNAVGMDTLVILLNARLGGISNFGTAAAAQLFGEQFETIFHLAAVTPQEAAPNCLLYRAYPHQEWALARKPTVGPPKVILTQSSRPSAEECRNAFDQLELSDVERGIENVVENVASWFR